MLEIVYIVLYICNMIHENGLLFILQVYWTIETNAMIDSCELLDCRRCSVVLNW